ncbi:MAG: sugar phosphate isomerase/epimerase [Phycisphaerales bacterium]|nr:sugar phosphate isomerase/epimerase [Phycisphaerales bacterium]
MTLLLTLSTSSLTGLFEDPENGPTSLLDVPSFAMDHLAFRGLYIDAAMLSGWSLGELDRLRDRADKAGCPCLVLHDEELLPLADADEAKRQEAINRVDRLAVAGNRLGCNAIAVRCADSSGEEAMERATEALRGVMASIERLELNLLLQPSTGLTGTPDGVTDLVKRVGGFRIGVLPTYGTAESAEDEIERLRRLAPYAGAMLFEIKAYRGKSGHTGADLSQGIDTLKKVGYASTVAIHYVGTSPMKDLDKAREELQAAIEAD